MGIFADRAVEQAAEEASRRQYIAEIERQWSEKARDISAHLATDVLQLTSNKVDVSVHLHTVLLRKENGAALQIAVEGDDQFRIGIRQQTEGFFYTARDNSWCVNQVEMTDEVLRWLRA